MTRPAVRFMPGDIVRSKYSARWVGVVVSGHDRGENPVFRVRQVFDRYGIEIRCKKTVWLSVWWLEKATVSVEKAKVCADALTRVAR